MITEADTCRKYVLPRLMQAGWDKAPHSFTEQKTFTDGRIVVVGTKTKRRPQKRADYLLRYTRDYMIAVVEAKSAYMNAGDGLQQAKEYAEIRADESDSRGGSAEKLRILVPDEHAGSLATIAGLPVIISSHHARNSLLGRAYLRTRGSVTSEFLRG